MDAQLYLASRSPRRQALLQLAGLRYELLDADVPEQPAAGEAPEAYAVRIACAKARAAQAHARQPLPVLAADTDVALAGAILGKPRDEDDAVAMLLRLAGHTHTVCSAVAVAHGARLESTLSVTQVAFGPVTEAQARAYWGSGEPRDKAGAYAIQGFGACFVREIRGSYTGVVGLPLYETLKLLSGFGIAPSLPSPVNGGGEKTT